MLAENISNDHRRAVFQFSELQSHPSLINRKLGGSTAPVEPDLYPTATVSDLMPQEMPEVWTLGTATTIEPPKAIRWFLEARESARLERFSTLYNDLARMAYLSTVTGTVTVLSPLVPTPSRMAARL